MTRPRSPAPPAPASAPARRDLDVRDLALRPRPDGRLDLALGADDLLTVEGGPNLVQALTVRLLTFRGELGLLGHPQYGSRAGQLVGRPMDRENLGLLRRLVRKTVLAEPRVKEVTALELATPRPGVVTVAVTVRPHAGPDQALKVDLDVG